MSLLSSLRHTVVLSAIFLGLGALQQARAATFIVTSTADTDGSTCDTNCTLRQAINAANGDPDDSNVITFDDTVLLPNIPSNSRTTTIQVRLMWVFRGFLAV